MESRSTTRVSLGCILLPKYSTDHELSRWLDALFKMLYPIHHTLGSVANLDKTRIPEYTRAVQVVNNWIRDFFFDATEKSTHRGFLTAAIQRACLALEFQPSNAQDIFKRSPWIANPPRGSPQRDGDRFLLHDLLDALTRAPLTGLISGMLAIK